MASKGAPDRKPPKLSLTSPAGGSATSDTTLALAGKAGRSTATGVRSRSGSTSERRPRAGPTGSSRRGAGSRLVGDPPPGASARYLHRQGSQRDGAETAAPAGLDIQDQAGAGGQAAGEGHAASRQAVHARHAPGRAAACPGPTAAITSPAAGAETADPKPSFIAQAATPARPGRSRSRSTPGLRWLGAHAHHGADRDRRRLVRRARRALDDGVYTAQVTVPGANGLTGRSAPLTFRVDTVAPQASLIAPADGAATSDTTPAFTGSAGARRGRLHAGSRATSTPA